MSNIAQFQILAQTSTSTSDHRHSNYPKNTLELYTNNFQICVRILTSPSAYSLLRFLLRLYSFLNNSFTLYEQILQPNLLRGWQVQKIQKLLKKLKLRLSKGQSCRYWQWWMCHLQRVHDYGKKIALQPLLSLVLHYAIDWEWKQKLPYLQRRI